jgi:hypothetical protein
VEQAVNDVDELIGALADGVPVPAAGHPDTVLVTGPWLAGVTSVVAALRDRLPELTVVEPAEAAGDGAAVVVFVVSAAAPLAESDCALLDAAAAQTDAVIGVVSKVDVHQRWREVLETNRELVSGHHCRYRDMPWLGVAAAPQLGEPQVDALVEQIRGELADPQLCRRNRLRQWENALLAECRAHDAAADDQEEVANRIRARRADVLAERRVDRSRRAVNLRNALQQARVQLSYFSRSRCSSVLAELQEDAAAMRRRGVAEFPDYVRRRADEVISEVDEGITAHFADVTAELDVAPVSHPGAEAEPPAPVGTPPLRSRRLETRLVMLLGAGFGLGVAVTASRLVADLAPGLTLAGAVVGAVLAVVVTMWVVGTRGLLQDRAVLDRWVGEVMAGVRAVTDQMVATRVLAAEAELTAALADREELATRQTAERIAEFDARLREQALARARAGAERARAVPELEQTLARVRAELDSNPSGHAVVSTDE